jgi:hypothetical protein
MEVRGFAMPGCNYRYCDLLYIPSTVSEIPWNERWSDEFENRFCPIFGLQFVAGEDCYLERILRRVRSPSLKWIRWNKYPYSCLPSWIPMGNLRVLEVAGSALEILWQREYQVMSIFLS